MSIQFLPPHLLPGLMSIQPGLQSIAQGIVGRDTPEAADWRNIKTDPGNYCNLNTGQWGGGAPAAMQQRLVFYDPKVRGNIAFDQMPQGYLPWIPGTTPPEWAALPETTVREEIPAKESGGMVGQNYNPSLDMFLRLIGIEKEQGEVPIRAHEGEAILNKQATQAIGPQNINTLNKQAQQIPQAQDGVVIGSENKTPMDMNDPVLIQLLQTAQGTGPEAMEARRIIESQYSQFSGVPLPTQAEAQQGMEQAAQYGPSGMDPALLQSLMERMMAPVPTMQQPGVINPVFGQVPQPEWQGSTDVIPPAPPAPPPQEIPSPPAGASAPVAIQEPAGPQYRDVTTPGQPGFNPWWNPMPVDWEKISQMDSGQALAYLQQLTNAQGAPLRSLSAPESMPYRQQLFNSLMANYTGMQGAEGQRLENVITEKYGERGALADISYKEALAAQARLGNLIGSPDFSQLDPTAQATVVQKYSNTLKNVADMALEQWKLNPSDRDAERSYYDTFLRFKFYTDPSTMALSTEDILKMVPERSTGFLRGKEPIFSEADVEKIRASVMTMGRPGGNLFDMGQATGGMTADEQQAKMQSEQAQGGATGEW